MNIKTSKNKNPNFLEPSKPVKPFVGDDDPAIRDAIERKALKEAAERLAYEASEAAKRDKAERDRIEIAANLAYLNDKNAANPLYDAEIKASYEKRMLELAEKEAKEKAMREAKLKQAEMQAREKARLRETVSYWTSDEGKRDKEILARYSKEMKGSLNLRIVMIKMLRKKIIKRIITLNIISDTNFKYFGDLKRNQL